MIIVLVIIDIFPFSFYVYGAGLIDCKIFFSRFNKGGNVFIGSRQRIDEFSMQNFAIQRKLYNIQKCLIAELLRFGVNLIKCVNKRTFYHAV
mgnify:CR=1 FL=1